MSNLSLFEPRLFKPTLSDPFDSMFNRFMAPLRADWESSALDMRLDITEADGKYEVRADIPGFKKDDINVRIDGNIVQIDAAAQNKSESKDEGGKALRSERWEGAVSRTFSLTQDVDESKASAKYEDGVLTLELPKKTSTISKRLRIQ
jgi:HSP20 family protein